MVFVNTIPDGLHIVLTTFLNLNLNLIQLEVESSPEILKKKCRLVSFEYLSEQTVGIRKLTRDIKSYKFFIK